MKCLIPLLFVVLLAPCRATGQEYGLYFMPEVWNANYLNPGFHPQQNVIVSLPSVHTSINVVGLNRAKLFRYNSEEDKYYLSPAEFVENLDRDVNLKSSLIVDPFAFGLKVNKFFFSLSSNTHLEANITLPQQFFDFAWDGTANHIGTTLEIGPDINAMVYQKLGLGASYQISPNLTIGLRINRLLGLASVQTERSHLAITQDSEIFQTDLDVDYLINYYAAGGLEPIDSEVEGIVNFDEEIGDTDFDFSSFSSINNNNNGWSIDLGGEYFYNEKWSFAASVINLGSINWRNKTQQLSLSENYTYEGFIIDDINAEDVIDVDELRDTLETLGDFRALANQSYRQGLSPKIYLSASYQLAPFARLGGLFYNEFTPFGTFTGFSLSGRLYLGSILSVGGLYTLQKGAHNSLGVNMALKLGPLQLYTVADNIAPLINPERLDGSNVRVGLNLAFGGKRKKADKILAATNPDSLQREQVLADVEEMDAQMFSLEVQFKDSLTTKNVDIVYVDIFRINDQGNSTLIRTGIYENGEIAISLEADESEHEMIAQASGYEAYKLTFRPIPGNELVSEHFLKPKANVAAEPIQEEPLGEDFITEQPQDFTTASTQAYEDNQAVEEDTDDLPSASELPSNPEVNELPDETASSANEAVTTESTPTETIHSDSTTDFTPPIAPKPSATPKSYPIKKAIPRMSYPVYYITQGTSLRSHATSQSDVLKRLPAGTELQLLEKSTDWWWYVSVNGQEGFVKAHLLGTSSKHGLR